MGIVAETILDQLGGNKFISMTGAKTLVAGDNTLQFRIPLSNGINSIVITLDSGTDEYLIEFYKIKGINFTLVSSEKGVYFDQLISVFEKETGLDTSL